MISNQKELLAYHSKNYRPRFNQELFERSTDDIIEDVKKVILSICNRGTYFSINVLNFEVVKDYTKIREILFNYGERYKNRNKDKTNENIYDYIDIKSTSFVLLLVTYELIAKEERSVITVPIAIPMFVNKYYLNIQGNLYLPQIQVVDASTYNNSLSNSKSSSVVLKTLSPPIRLYRRVVKLITLDKQIVNATYYDLNAFRKTSRSFKYILAEYGYSGGFHFLGLEGITVYDEAHKPYSNPEFYIFHNNDNITMKKSSAKVDVYIQVPKFLYDNDTVTQNMIVTIIDSSIWLTHFQEIFTTEFWRRALGADFKSDTVEKGLGILTSFKGILDNITKETLHLPPELKNDIFCLLKWMVCEFSALRAKDNLNILTKRIRIAEYIAAMYASKLNLAFYRIPDIGQRVSIESLRKVVVTDPMYLIKQVASSNLVAFRDIVTDCDATEVTKYSIKGQSGLGDNSSNSIPVIYRYPHESKFGIIDMDAASPGDPGVTGIICPMTKLYGSSHSFSEFEEPNSWPETYAKLLDEYHRVTGVKEAIILRNRVLGEDNSEQLIMAQQILDITAANIDMIMKTLQAGSVDGRICPFIDLNSDGEIKIAMMEEDK